MRFLRIGIHGWVTVCLLLLGLISLILKWPLVLVLVIHVVAYYSLGLYIRNQFNLRMHRHRRP